jgi:hypothetical protein
MQPISQGGLYLTVGLGHLYNTIAFELVQLLGILFDIGFDVLGISFYSQRFKKSNSCDR